jgi:hypothetical protein
MEFEVSDTLAIFSGSQLQPKKLYMLVEAVPDGSVEGLAYVRLQIRLVALTEEELNKDYELDDLDLHFATSLTLKKYSLIKRKTNGIPAP